MMWRTLLLAVALAWAGAAQSADPAPPYYSLQLSSTTEFENSAAELRQLQDIPAARVEKRGEYFAVRVGAWRTRREALDALPVLQARGYSDAAVLRITRAVRWIEPTPENLVLPGAPSLPEAPAAAAPTAPPAPSTAPRKPRALEIPPAEQDFATAAQALDWQVHNIISTAGPARRDGFIYTLDMATLMLYAAQRGDRDFYDQLRRVVEPLVWNRPKDPFSRGFVLWRYRKGEPAEITGATEGIHLARALWTGAQAFGLGDDRALALRIIEGYTQHAYVLGGDWLVRKYYAFGNNVFSNLSVIGSYLPDFLHEVEKTEGAGSAGPTLAERSYGVLERAVSDTGLLYPIIQPEVNQTYPGLDLDVYAPNNVLPAADSCEAALAAIRGRPRIAEGVLEFVRDRDRRDRTGYLYAYFDATRGTRIRRQVVGGNTLACLARLATALEDKATLEWLQPLLLVEIRSLASVPAVQEAPLFSAGPLLLAADAMGAFRN